MDIFWFLRVTDVVVQIQTMPAMSFVCGNFVISAMRMSDERKRIFHNRFKIGRSYELYNRFNYSPSTINYQLSLSIS